MRIFSDKVRSRLAVELLHAILIHYLAMPSYEVLWAVLYLFSCRDFCLCLFLRDASNKEQIDIQGDYLYEMPEFLLKTYQEALSGDVDIILVEDKQRRKFKR